MNGWSEEAAEADLDPCLGPARAGVMINRGLQRVREVGLPTRAFYTMNKLVDMAKVDRRMISAVKVDRPDMLVGQKVRSQLVVNKADIVPDPEASMDLLKDKELIGLKEFGRSKVKSEENLGEQDQKKNYCPTCRDFIIHLSFKLLREDVT